MYQSLLTRRYLTSKVMPLLAALAVLLCTAMVLVVWSVMGGFLNMLLASGRMLIGDVIISWPVQGIPHYESLIRDLESDPMVDAATGTIESPALLKLPEGTVRMVTAVGVDGPSYDKVTGFGESLWWRHLEKPLPKDTERKDPRLEAGVDRTRQGLSLTMPDRASGQERPAAVLGVEVSGFNRREPGGWITPRWFFMPNEEVTLSVLPLTAQGAVINVEARTFPVANEFRSGLFEIDQGQVFVRLDALQRMLRMHSAQRVERGFDFNVVEDGGDGEAFAVPGVVGGDPARVTSVLIRASDGVTPEALKARVAEVYRAFALRHTDAPEPDFVRIDTWQERPGVATFVAAVKKETALVLALFAFISLTAVFLVFAIFWAMVSEKVRDIGILRAMGASRAGVAWVFIRYGVVIGAVGALAGGALAVVIVRNINPIHDWLGRAVGLYVWDPSIYYFSEIPSQVEPLKAVIVLVCGVVFSVIGSIIPAAKAANMDPVRALRFE